MSLPQPRRTRPTGSQVVAMGLLQSWWPIRAATYRGRRRIHQQVLSGHSSDAFWLCHPGVGRNFGDTWINRVADEVLQIQETMASSAQAYAVDLFGKEALHKRLAVHWKFNNEFVHEVDMATAPHSEVEI